MNTQTIYALSTVLGKSGVAVIRISGVEALNIVSKITNIKTNKIKPRYAYFTNIVDPKTKELLDKALVLYFKAPHSFTGEDVLEIQCHGSKAVLNSVFKVMSLFKNVRLAEPGEFSKRAFYNGKMDLTESEGLADLIDAETKEQQKYAIRQLSGSLKNLYSSWREDLVKTLSFLEAYIDFPDEEIPDNLSQEILNTVFKVKKNIKEHLSENNLTEQLKNGFKVVIAGETNSGKSSLINALTQSNTMIVSDVAGTTRDSVDINLDIKGYPIVITDTAGIRRTKNKIEKIGIDIALDKIKKADIVLALYDATTGSFNENLLKNVSKDKVIYIANKADKLSEKEKTIIKNKKHLLISAKYGQGLVDLTNSLVSFLEDRFFASSGYLITRTRYKECLQECLENLERFSLDKEIALSAEDIRLACRAIGTITGEVSVDEVLDNIFSSFCIGK